MAMPFGNPAIDALHSRLKQAVSETGFDLRRLDEKPKAGLIDDHLRVEIRTSRFLVVDLTDGNQGAYWEAGFGEIWENTSFTAVKKLSSTSNGHISMRITRIHCFGIRTIWRARRQS